MSEANRVSIKYVAEVTPGTTPTNSINWKYARFLSQNFNATPKTVVSNEIRSDRMVSDLIVVGQENRGDIGVELSAASYDDWLEAAMGGTWSTNVLKAGTTEKWFSFEVGFEDWTTVQYLQYKGVRVGGFNFDFPYGDVVKGSFNFAGLTALQSTTSLKGSGTVAAVNTNSVMNAAAGMTAITLDGGAPGAAVKSIKLNLDNSVRAVEGVGSAGPTDLTYGRSMVTGSIEMYFETIAMYTKLLAGTSAALAWTVSDGAKSYAFLLPKIKFNSGAPVVTGVDTDVMINLDFTALYDGSETTNLKITRVP